MSVEAESFKAGTIFENLTGKKKTIVQVREKQKSRRFLETPEKQSRQITEKRKKESISNGEFDPGSG